MSTRNGRLTPVNVSRDPLWQLVSDWRKEAEEMEGPASAKRPNPRMLQLRECARELEFKLSKIKAIVR